MIDRKVVREAVVKGLMEIQTYSGYPIPTLTDETCPLEDLLGFDSPNALELSFLIAGYLDCEINDDLFLRNHFGKRPTVAEMVDRITVDLNKI